MVYTGITLSEGTDMPTLTAPSGTTFPSTALDGDFFFRTDSNDMYVRDNTTWNIVTTGDSANYLRSDVADTAAGTITFSNAIQANGGLSQDGNTILNGSDTWLRTTGNTGWLSSHGGGMYMIDTAWVRVYGSKKLYVANEIAATGDVTAFYSDERLKTIIKPIDNALAAVLSWRAVQYKANDAAGALGYDTSLLEIGLLTQDVEKQYPELVKDAPINIDNDTDYKTLKYDRVVSVLVAAMQEQQQTINTMQDRLLVIESRWDNK